MTKIVMIVSFELNDPSLIEDWKKISAMISDDLAGVDGFIYRDSAISEDKTVFCILKWNSKEHQQKFRAELESSKEWPAMMADFARIVNMETMKQEFLEVL